MENKFEEFKNNIKGKKIAVLGLGVSNIPAIIYLNRLGAVIYAHDRIETLEEKHEEIKKLDNIRFYLGNENLKDLDKVDYILRSPGVKPFLPEIEDAVKKGVKLTSEIELLVEYAPCIIIGITGSAGKTTTTTLVTEVLKDAGYKVWTGGNIGIPLFTKLDEIKKEDIIVLELSSFQLMTMKKSPNVSLLTNIYEDHLDYHRDFNEYVMAKTNIFSHQSEEDICILNNDSEFTKEFEKLILDNNLKNNIIYFSENKLEKNGAYIQDGCIYYNENGKTTNIIDIAKLKLKGNKNYLNICSAICAVKSFVDIESIRNSLMNFKGVEHRLEYVATKNGVEYYNDSISTTPGKAMAALTAFDKKIMLIAGGYDKNLDYSTIGSYIIKSCKEVILLGNTSEKIYNSIINDKEYNKEEIKIEKVNSLEEAVTIANSKANIGDIVVMSPASASFDMFKSYKERGNIFKELVNKI